MRTWSSLTESGTFQELSVLAAPLLHFYTLPAHHVRPLLCAFSSTLCAHTPHPRQTIHLAAPQNAMSCTFAIVLEVLHGVNVSPGALA